MYKSTTLGQMCSKGHHTIPVKSGGCSWFDHSYHHTAYLREGNFHRGRQTDWYHHLLCVRYDQLCRTSEIFVKRISISRPSTLLILLTYLSLLPWQIGIFMRFGAKSINEFQNFPRGLGKSDVPVASLALNT